MRVLIVDDSAFMRRAIRQMLTTDPQIEVVGTARNGREGVEMAGSLKPDVVTLDIEMPEMDGLTALKQIMRESPTQVLMLSSLTTEGSHVALQALKLGAADVLAKDMSQFSLSITNIQDDLLRRVRALGGIRKARQFAPPAPRLDHAPPKFRPGQFDVVCIGSSTGGPPVLEKILEALPATFNTPIVVAQHMPAVFTQSMTERLNDSCNLRVVHVDQRMPLEPRTIYIARGSHNIHIRKLGLARWELITNKEPADTIYWPSVDVLFHSAAQHTGSRTLAIVLTGIGEDGLLGATELFKRQSVILAQDQETCVVYGMPKAVTEKALIAASLPPEEIAKSLLTLASSSSLTHSARAG